MKDQIDCQHFAPSYAQRLITLLLLSIALSACTVRFSSPKKASAEVLDDTALPIKVLSVSPATGSVQGAYGVTLTGEFPTSTYSVSIGGTPCTSVTQLSETELTCVAGNRGIREGASHVVVLDVSTAESGTLLDGFQYTCPWTWNAGTTTSCGAAPPQLVIPGQALASTVTTFQPGATGPTGHGFVSNGLVDANMADTGDFVLGVQSAYVTTAAASTAARTIKKVGMTPIDFTGKVAKIWVKVENVANATSLQVYLGDSNLINHYKFSFLSGQSQKWTTDGDWVSFTIPWSPSNYVVAGTPNRAAITDVQFRVTSDAAAQVTLHVNGLSLVDEPATAYPNGVVSFTFDDGYDDQYDEALPVLSAQGFSATAYVIADRVGTATYMTLDELKTLQNTAGWEIAAHSYLQSSHQTMFPLMTPADLLYDIVSIRSWLMSNGFNGYDNCAYPHGEFKSAGGTDVLAAIRAHFGSCRTIYKGQREAAVPSDAAKLRTLYVTSSDSLATIQAAIDEVVANREWGILVFHRLVNVAPGAQTEWPVADFTALAAYIKAKGVPVKTVREVLGN